MENKKEFIDIIKFHNAIEGKLNSLHTLEDEIKKLQVEYQNKYTRCEDFGADYDVDCNDIIITRIAGLHNSRYYHSLDSYRLSSLYDLINFYNTDFFRKEYKKTIKNLIINLNDKQKEYLKEETLSAALTALNSDKDIFEMCFNEYVNIYDCLKKYVGFHTVRLGFVPFDFAIILSMTNNQEAKRLISDYIGNNMLYNYLAHVNNFSDRPEYYSGCDIYGCNSPGQMLGIFQYLFIYNEEYAKQYVNMISKMRTLGATEFLLSLSNLADNNFAENSKVSYDNDYEGNLPNEVTAILNLSNFCEEYSIYSNDEYTDEEKEEIIQSKRDYKAQKYKATSDSFKSEFMNKVRIFLTVNNRENYVDEVYVDDNHSRRRYY